MFAADKFCFGLRLRELGFIEDFARMVVTIPVEKREAVIAWLRELKQARTVGREEFRSLVHTLVSFQWVVKRGRARLGRFFRTMSGRWGRAFSRAGDRVVLTPGIQEHVCFWEGALLAAQGSAMMAPQRRLPDGASWESDACRCLDPGGVSGAGGFLPRGPGYYWREVFPDFVAKWLSIDKLECYAVLMNTAVFGGRVQNHHMYDDCDNAGVVYALDNGAPQDPVLQEMVMYRHDLKARFCIETAARHFPGWLNVCTDHLSRDRLEDFLQAAASRGYPRPVELQVDESLRAFGWSLAEMVRDHQSTSEDFVSRDSESSLNNLPTDVSGDGPPGPRWSPAPVLGGASPFLRGGAAPARWWW